MKLAMISKGLMCALTGLVLLVGCSDEEKTESESASGQESSAPARPSDDGAVETGKWNAYVDLSNTMSGGYYRAIELYLEAFGRDEVFRKPAAESKQMDFTNACLGWQAESLTKSIDRVVAVSAGAPKTELDQSAAALAPDLKALWTDVLSMATYLKNKDYVDDDYAKAKKLHPGILAAIVRVDGKIHPFVVALTVQEGEMRQANLKAMREDGLEILPAMLEVLTAAENIQVYLDQNHITSQTMDHLKMDTFRPLYDELATKLQALKGVISEDKAEKEGLRYLSVGNYYELAQDVKTSAAGLIERHDKKANAPMIPGMVAGTPEYFLTRFSTLVERYNGIVR